VYLTLRSRPADAPAVPSPAMRRVTRTVVLLGLVSMVTDISTESVNAVLPNYLILVVGLSPQAFGVVNGLYNGVSALVRILAGWLADRTDHPKWVALVGYLISMLSKIALLPAHTFAAFSAIASVDQVGKGIRTGPRDGMIAASSPPEILGRSFGVHRSLDTFGAFLGPLLAFWILTVVPNGFHSVFVAATAFAVIGVAILLLVVPDVRPRRQTRAASPITSAPATPAEPSGAGGPGRVTLRHLANPQMARLLTAAGLLGLLTVGETYVFLELQARASLALRYFALLIVGMNLVYLLLAVPLGRLADRIGRWRVFVGGHVALMLAYLAAAGPFGGPYAGGACLLLLGAYYAATDGVLAAMAGSVVDVSVRTSGIATVQTVAAGAAFFSSIGFAELWSLMGRAQALRLVAALLVVGIVIAVLLLRGLNNVEHRAGVGQVAR
jgi:Na+/melibiose symporter-like transporter